MRTTHTARPSRRLRDGFSLLEVLVAMILIAMIGTAAAATIREGIGVMEGTEDSGRAVSALAELHQFTVDKTLEEIEALDGQSMAPILGNGDPLPGSDGLTMSITVQTVDDLDPNTVVAAGTTGTRRITATVANDTQVLESASWLATEN